MTPQSAGIPGRALVKNHPNDWEPRAGIAWSPGSCRQVGIPRRARACSTAATPYRKPVLWASFRRTTARQRSPACTISSLAPFNPNRPSRPTQLQTLEPNYDNPLSYQYSAGIQYSLTSDTLLAVGYAGSHQIHQGLNVDINQVPIADLPGRLRITRTAAAPLASIPIPFVLTSATATSTSIRGKHDPLQLAPDLFRAQPHAWLQVQSPTRSAISFRTGPTRIRKAIASRVQNALRHCRREGVRHAGSAAYAIHQRRLGNTIFR